LKATTVVNEEAVK